MSDSTPSKLGTETIASATLLGGKGSIEVKITDRRKLVRVGDHKLHDESINALVSLASKIRGMVSELVTEARGAGRAPDKDARKAVLSLLWNAWENNPDMTIGQLIVLIVGDEKDLVTISDQFFYDRIEAYTPAEHRRWLAEQRAKADG